MKVEVRIDPGCGETAVTITAPALTDEVRALAARLEGGGAGVLPALALWGPLFAGGTPPLPSAGDSWTSWACRGGGGHPGAVLRLRGGGGGPCGFPGRTQKRPSRTKLPRTGVQTLAAPPCFTARRGRALCGIPTYPRQLTYASRREILGRSRSSRPP